MSFSKKETRQYFLYTIKCVGSNKVYVGMSNSVSDYYNPLNYFITQHTENGLYSNLNKSIKEFGRSKHIVTRLDRDGCYEIDLETAEKLKYKFIAFYKSNDRSLNDDNEEPIRYSCKCGWRILESKKDSHYCKSDVSKDVMEELPF